MYPRYLCNIIQLGHIYDTSTLAGVSALGCGGEVVVVAVGARQGAEAARRRRKRDVSSENITHRIEPWQSEGLSEMVPHGTETGG